MVIDRLKLVSQERASKIANVDRDVITRATKLWSESKGSRGLAYVILPGQSRPRIRLCAIDDWCTRMEDDSRYV